MKNLINILLAFVVLGNQIWFQTSSISPAAVQPTAQAKPTATVTPTPKPTTASGLGAYPPPVTPTSQLTSTPAPVVTPTPVPTVTPPVIPTSQEPQGIELSAEPAIYIPGQPITLSLTVNLTETKSGVMGMAIQIPDGVHSTNKAMEASIDAKRVMKMIASTGVKSNYSLSWNVDEATAKPPFVFSVALTQNDGTMINSNSVVIGAGQYQVDAGIGKSNIINTSENAVNLTVPGDAVDNSLAIDVRSPSENKMPPYSLSGSPIEIIAVEKTTAKNVTKFKQPLTLTMKYDPEVFMGHNEENLSLFYYNESLHDWYPMETRVDTKAKTLTALTDHLTVFDYNLNNWQFRNLPSVDSFKVSDFTGAGTYEMNLWMPPGTAGFHPNLTLSYNSQVIDEARAFSQASWVGLGWSLDTPAITVNFHETESDTTDDTYYLSLNGISGLLLPVSQTGNKITYNTQNQSFIKVVRDTTNKDWTVFAKDGATYYFGVNNRAKTSTQGCALNDGDLNLTWRWSIDYAQDKFGNQINYSYYPPDTKTGCLNQLAVNPQYITYANGHYRVYFERETRYDYKDSWGDSSSKVLFSKNRLRRIWIEYQAENSSQWSDTTGDLRQYEFIYGSNSSNLIYPNLKWTHNSVNYPGALTLISVQEKQGVTTNPSALKPTQFFYDDMMHLGKVDNSQGGQVQMQYQQWQYFTDSTSPTLRDQGTGTCTSPDTQGWIKMTEKVECDNSKVQFYNINNTTDGGKAKHPLSEQVLKPGGNYRVALIMRNIADPQVGTGVTWGMVDTANNLVGSMKGNTRIYGTAYTSIEATLNTTAAFDPNNTYLQVQCDLCKLGSDSNAWQVKLFPLYYRVTSRTVTDAVTGRTTTLNYSYDNAAPNVWETSETIRNNGTSYFGPWREYRGNAFVRTIDAGNIANYAWYYQNDYLKGSAYHSITAKELVYNDFESLPKGGDGSITSLPGWQPAGLNVDQVYAGSLYSKEFDSAAYTTSIGTGMTSWSTPILRNDSTEIVDGRTIVSHIKLSQYKPYLVNGNYATIASDVHNIKGEFGLISNTNQFFGVYVSWDTLTSKYKAYLCETTNDTCNTSGPVLNADFKLDLYYVLLIVVDSTNGSQVRLWREDNIPGQDTTVIKTGMSGINWQYRQRAYNATLWLDSYSVSLLHGETENKYSTILQNGNQVSGHPLSDTTLNGYYDLNVYWNQLTATITRQYGAGRLWQGTKTEYGYDLSDQNNGQYGNQTRVSISSGGVSSATSNPDAWTFLRGTHTQFYPLDNAAAYLVSLPARTVSLDCSSGCDFTNNGNLKAETLYLYDANTAYSTAPTVGKLSIQKVRAKDPNDTGNVKYSQTDYGYDTHGNVNAVSTYQDYATANASPTGVKYTSNTTYDSWYFAYPLTVTNPKNQITTTSYNYKLGVPEKVTDPNGVVTGASYDVFGRMLSVCAPDDWDGTTCPATGSTLSVAYNDFVGQSSPFNIALTQKVDGSTFKREVRYFDGTGKLLQVQQPGAQLNIGTANIVMDTVYDSLGRVAKQSKPFTYTGTIAYQTQAAPYVRDASTTTYDDWSRVSNVSEPDGTTSAYAYGFAVDADVNWSFKTSQTNANQQTTIQLQDAFGRVRKVIPPTENSAAIAPSLKYVYDALDRLTEVYQGSTNTHFVYDESGRKTSMTDPDMGTWNYTYDPQGNLKTQSDARGCVTTLTYDGLNRLTNKTFSGTNCTAVPAITYYYDNYSDLTYTPGSNYGVGQRTGMTDPSGKTVWEYDARGRKVMESKTVSDGTNDFGTYVTRWAYNSADWLTVMTYPNLERVTNTYLPQGLLTGVSSQAVNYVPSTVYDLNGRVTALNLGLGNSTYNITYNYTAWNQNLKGGRLNWIKAGTQSAPSALQYLGFDSDAVGNLKTISDYKTGPNRDQLQTQTFHYDALNRLKDAAAQGGGGTAYGDYATETYTYTDTQTGNLIQKAGNTLSYTQQNSSCPSGALPAKTHAVTSATGTGVSASYCYDLNGNMNQRTVNTVTTNFSYDAANNMISAAIGSISESYTFDGDGNRVILKSGTKTTVFIGNYFEITLDSAIELPTNSTYTCPYTPCRYNYIPVMLRDPIYEPPALQEWRSYFYAGSKLIAMRVQGGTRAILGELYYMFGDYLGSTSLMVKADGLALTDLKYKPWGEPRPASNGTTLTTIQYTGQRVDSTTSLYWYNSRWYDSSIGRFIQPDSIVPNPKDTQSFDRFAYVNNNPINYADPTGHDPYCKSKLAFQEDCKKTSSINPNLPSQPVIPFEKSPIDSENIVWLQWYGGTTFAQSKGKNSDYANYAQGFHAGMDLGVSKETHVRAGTYGKVTLICRQPTCYYPPGFIIISQYDGARQILYGHLTISIEDGADVTPDTIIGSTADHVHLEYSEVSKSIEGNLTTTYKNPLTLLPNEDQKNLENLAKTLSDPATGYLYTINWTAVTFYPSTNFQPGVQYSQPPIPYGKGWMFSQ